MNHSFAYDSGGNLVFTPSSTTYQPQPILAPDFAVDIAFASTAPFLEANDSMPDFRTWDNQSDMNDSFMHNSLGFEATANIEPPGNPFHSYEYRSLFHDSGHPYGDKASPDHPTPSHRRVAGAAVVAPFDVLPMQDRHISVHHDPDSSVIVSGNSPTVTTSTNQSESIATSPNPFNRASKHGIGDSPGSSGNTPQPTVSLASYVCQCKTCVLKRATTCSCVACQFVPLTGRVWGRICCRYRDCGEKMPWIHDDTRVLSLHERKHFERAGKYYCPVEHCPMTGKGFKRWPELTRHSKVTHCKSPEKFTCHVLGCKYRENGFARKDKLASHIRNVHAGKSTPGKGLRKLQPAVKTVGGSAPMEN